MLSYLKKKYIQLDKFKTFLIQIYYIVFKF